MLVLGFVALGAGIGAGLMRLGWGLPLSPALVAVHGPLMVSGFFGTVIGLERAVALGRAWAYTGPLCTALGGALLIGGAPPSAAGALMGLGSLVLVWASLHVLLRQPALFTAALVLGAMSWLAANGLWLAGRPVEEVVPWWVGFLVLTIAGERLELSRFLPPAPGARRVFVLIVALLVVGMGSIGLRPALGALLVAGSLLALTLWLVRHDIARRTVRESGLPRFIAVCLLSGYLWLGVAGALGLSSGGAFTAGVYDATLHGVFLGFVFAMVFGHAPIIFPAVTGLPVHYHPIFYAHLALLHLSLGLRVVGDLGGWHALRSAGGLLNAMTILVFALNTVAGVWRGWREQRALSSG